MKDYKQIEEQALTFEGIADVSTDDEPELKKLCLKAEEYLLRHHWCKNILDGWLAVYWEGVLSICLFKIDPSNAEVDEYVWIVSGDIPTAYVDVESGRNPKEVLESYVLIMNEWADNVLEGKTIEESYPVEAPPTREFATILKKRLDILNDFIGEEFD